MGGSKSKLDADESGSPGVFGCCAEEKQSRMLVVNKRPGTLEKSYDAGVLIDDRELASGASKDKENSVPLSPWQKGANGKSLKRGSPEEKTVANDGGDDLLKRGVSWALQAVGAEEEEKAPLRTESAARRVPSSSQYMQSLVEDNLKEKKRLEERQVANAEKLKKMNQSFVAYYDAVHHDKEELAKLAQQRAGSSEFGRAVSSAQSAVRTESSQSSSHHHHEHHAHKHHSHHHHHEKSQHADDKNQHVRTSSNPARTGSS